MNFSKLFIRNTRMILWQTQIFADSLCFMFSRENNITALFYSLGKNILSCHGPMTSGSTILPTATWIRQLQWQDLSINVKAFVNVRQTETHLSAWFDYAFNYRPRHVINAATFAFSIFISRMVHLQNVRRLKDVDPFKCLANVICESTEVYRESTLNVIINATRSSFVTQNSWRIDATFVNF